MAGLHHRRQAGDGMKRAPLLGTHWHFAAGTDVPRMNFGAKQKLIAGKTYSIKGQPVPCERGFHASRRAIDALRYSRGAWVSRVSLSGIIVPHGGDKECAQGRTHHVFADATKTLHEFACWCAERALRAERKAGREPDPRSWAAIKTKRAWLKGKASDSELDAARDAARDAAWAAVWDAVWDAAWAATWAAARDAQNRKLEAMLGKLLAEVSA